MYLAQKQESSSPKENNIYGEAWRWQHHEIGLFLFSWDLVRDNIQGYNFQHNKSNLMFVFTDILSLLVT